MKSYGGLRGLFYSDSNIWEEIDCFSQIDHQLSIIQENEQNREFCTRNI